MVKLKNPISKKRPVAPKASTTGTKSSFTQKKIAKVQREQNVSRSQATQIVTQGANKPQGKTIKVTLHDGVGASSGIGKNVKVKLSESIAIQDRNEIIRVRNQSNKILEELRRQERLRVKELQRLRELRNEEKNRQVTAKQKQLSSATGRNRTIARRRSPSSLAPRMYADLGKMRRELAELRNKPSSDYNTRETNALTQTVESRSKVIGELRDHRKDVRKVEFQDNFGNSSQGQEPQQTGIPTGAVAGLVTGAGSTAKTYKSLVSTKGIENIGRASKPKGKLIKVTIQDGVGTSGGGKKPKNDFTEQFYPTRFTKGRTSKGGQGLGRDYVIGYEPTQPSKKTPQISNIPLEATQQRPQDNRGIEGALSVPLNLKDLAVEGGKGIASDISKGKFGTTEPPPLRKDIIISPLGSGIDVGSKLLTGDAKGAFELASKDAQNFAKDFVQDNNYWKANIGANVVLVAGTLGVGVIPSVLRVATKPKSRARGIVDYVFPNQPQTIEVIRTSKTKGRESPANKIIPDLEITTRKVTNTQKVEVRKASQKVESTTYGNIAKATEKTGKVETRTVSPYESIETIGGQKIPTTLVSFKGGKVTQAVIRETPNPTVEFIRKSDFSSQHIPKPTRTVLQFEPITARNLLKAQKQAKTPQQRQRIYEAFARSGRGAKLTEVSTKPQKYFLGDVKTGKVSEVSESTAKALGARGKQVYESETFTLSEIQKGRSVFGEQFGNLFREGKIKDASGVLDKGVKGQGYQRNISRYGMDLQTFRPEETALSRSKATAYDIKTRQPISFEKMTGFDWMAGQLPDASTRPNIAGLPKPSRPKTTSKPFDSGDLPNVDQLTVKQQKEMFNDFMGKGFASVEKSGTQKSVGIISSQQSDAKGVGYSGIIGQEPATVLRFPQEKLENSFNIKVFSDVGSKTDQDKVMGMPPAFDLDVKPQNLFAQEGKIKQTPKQRPVVRPDVDTRIDTDIFQIPKQDTKQTPEQITSSIFKNPPVEVPVTDVPPYTPPPPRTPPRTPAQFGLPFDFALDDELFGDKKRGKKEPRYWDVNPDKVLDFIGTPKGYSTKEFKQFKKGKKKKRKDFGGYDTIGF